MSPCLKHIKSVFSSQSRQWYGRLTQQMPLKMHLTGELRLILVPWRQGIPEIVTDRMLNRVIKFSG